MATKQLELYWEVQPWHLNQEWGRLDPKTYSQFGFDRHNGIDIRPGDRKEVRASIPCEVFRGLWQPNGGGLVLSVISTEQYLAPDGKPAYVLIDYMHLEKYVRVPGGTAYKCQIGDVLAIADNTGFSTGPHTHGQYRWVRKNAKAINGIVDVEKNDANNSFDPEPYRNGKYAADQVFDRDLYLGVEGQDVLRLQQYLNTHGFKVATTGAGSPGKETEFFGTKTQDAVIAYQKAKKITPAAGYFGPKTRASITNP